MSGIEKILTVEGCRCFCERPNIKPRTVAVIWDIGRSVDEAARSRRPMVPDLLADQSNGPLVQRGLEIVMMVLDRGRMSEAMVWTSGPGGS